MDPAESFISRQTEIAHSQIITAIQDLNKGEISQATIDARMNKIFAQLEKLPSLDNQLQGNLQKLLLLCQTHKFTLTLSLNTNLLSRINTTCLKLLGILTNPLNHQSLQISSIGHSMMPPLVPANETVEEITARYQETLQSFIQGNLLICPTDLIEHAISSVHNNPDELRGFLRSLKALLNKNPDLGFCIQGQHYSISLSLLINLMGKTRVDDLLLKEYTICCIQQKLQSIILPGYIFYTLKSSSDFFQLLHSGGFQEKGQQIFTLQDVHSDILNSMLDHLFVSTSTLKNTTLENLMDYLRTAAYLQIKPLKKLYVKELLRRLPSCDVETILQYIILAQMTDAKRLKKQAQMEFGKILNSSPNAEELERLLTALIENEVPVDALTIDCQFFGTQLLTHLNALNSLKDIQLVSCSSLIDLSQLNHASLRELTLRECSNLKNICNFAQIPCLSLMMIKSCPMLGNQIDFSQATSLRTLDLSGVSVALPSLTILPVRTLALRDSKIDLSEINSLASLTKLEILDLSKCELSEDFDSTIIQEWHPLPQLQILTLDLSNFPPELLIKFIQLGSSTLLQLNLSGCRVNSEVLIQIGKITSLTRLNLSLCRELKSEDLDCIKTLTNLTVLLIPSHLSRIAKEIFKNLIESRQLTLQIDKKKKTDEPNMHDCTLS